MIEDDDWLEGGIDAEEPETEEAAPVRGEIVSKVRMGAILGIARMTMDRIVKDGCPVVTRGNRSGQIWKLNTAAVIDWLRKRDVALATGHPDAASFDVAKLRDKEAQARLRELQIAEREGALVESAKVIDWIKRSFGDVRSRVLAIESQVAGLTDEQRDQLKTALHDALGDLSDEKADGWNDGPIASGEHADDDSEF